MSTHKIEIRIEELERQTLRLASAINDLQARMDSIQKNADTSGIVPLSSGSISVSDSPIVDSRSVIMPDGMKRTMDVLLRQPKRSLASKDISEVTGRARHLESSYLCRLYEQGFLHRKRVGRKVYYSFAEKTC